MDIVEDLGDVPFMLFGDFNARTGNENPESGDVTEFLFNPLANENYIHSFPD